MTPALETEKQLRDLRVGLKLVACVVSPILTIHLFFSINKLLSARTMFFEMGDFALPGLSKLFLSHPILLQSLPILSLLAFMALLLTCLRHRNAAFLYVFAASLAVHLILIWLIDLATFLPFYNIIQNMQGI